MHFIPAGLDSDIASNFFKVSSMSTTHRLRVMLYFVQSLSLPTEVSPGMSNVQIYSHSISEPTGMCVHLYVPFIFETS